MNGWISKKWMIAPMASPSAVPRSRPTTRTRTGGHPAASSEAVTIPVSATTDPTERSMPPVRMTNVIPTATTSRKALSMKMFSTTCGSPNAG